MRSNFKALCVAMLSLGMIGASLATAVGAKRATIIIEDRSTPGLEPIVSVDRDGQSDAFQKMPSDSNNKAAASRFKYELVLPDDRWFSDVDIKILWRNAYLNDDGSKMDFSQRLKVRIRRTFPEQLRIPIYFSNNRSDIEILRLENMHDINDQFEVMLRAEQIMNYYAISLGKTSKHAKRAAHLFFESSDFLAEEPDVLWPLYIFVMNSDAERAVIDSWEGASDYAAEKVYYHARALGAYSTYWFDLSRTDRLVALKDCTSARLLVDEMAELRMKDQELFNLRYKPDPTKPIFDVITEKKKIISAGCDPSTQ